MAFSDDLRAAADGPGGATLVQWLREWLATAPAVVAAKAAREARDEGEAERLGAAHVGDKVSDDEDGARAASARGAAGAGGG